MFVKRLRKMNF